MNSRLLQHYAAKFAFDSKTRVRTWKKLATQSHHAISLKESMKTLHDQAQTFNPRLAAVFSQISSHLGSGHSLGTAITGYATSEEIMLISSAQKAGRLSEGLAMAAEILTVRRTILSAVATSLAYPVFLFLLASTMLGIVSVYVMPQLASLSDPAQWSGFARVFYLICAFIGSWGGFSFYLATFIGVMAIFVSLPLWTGPSRSAVDDYAPWSLYRLTVGGVWLFTLATFMRSGMQLSHILSSMQSSDATSPYLRERVGAIRAQVARGENIGEAMYLCGFNFPDRQLINDFRVYATLPQFKDKLLELSREWLFDGIELIKQKTRILNVVLLVFIIGQMAMIALSVMDIQSQISVQTMGGVK